MNNITALLHKEWLEFKQRRALLLSIIFIPLLLTMIPLVALYAIGHTPKDGSTRRPSVASRQCVVWRTAYVPT